MNERIEDSSLFARYPDSAAIAASTHNRVADIEVAGTVVGSPTYFFGRRTHAWHEEFEIVTEHGLHLRVIDNVDLAPRVPVSPGDVVAVAGQFIPTHDVGIVHDTHHSPGPGWHRGGWVEWHGRTFEL
jgi:hypothetical protein